MKNPPRTRSPSTVPTGLASDAADSEENLEIDLELLVPDPGLSLAEGAIEPFTKTSYRRQMRKLLAFAEEMGIDTEKPFSEFSAKDKDLVLNGNDHYYGVKGYFKRLERKKLQNPHKGFSLEVPLRLYLRGLRGKQA